MLHLKKIVFMLTKLIVIGFLFYLKSVDSSPIHQQVSLYNSSDHVTILNVDNFYDGLLGKQHAWLLQFYSSYCGHCIAFAPLFKVIVKNISDWGHTIKPAVLNCAMDENVGLCRQYEVLGYPTLTLLPANVAKEDLGNQIDGTRTITAMRKTLVHYVEVQQAGGNGSNTWANLIPFSGTTEELFVNAGDSVTEAVVFVDDANSTKARETLMDLGYFKEVVVARWMVPGTSFLRSLPSPSSLPALLLLDRHSGRPPRLLPDAFPSSSQLTATAINMLGLEPEILPSYRIQLDESAAIDEGLGAGDGSDEGDAVKDELNLDRLNYDDNLPDSYYNPEGSSGDQVYLVDVENALSIALMQEVGLHKTLAGERLEALKQFMSVLVKYLPSRPKVHAFLSDLYKSVAKFQVMMSNTEYSAAVERASQHGLLPDQQEWMRCRGSESHLRGFPCGLWTTFHLLTVSAAADPQPDANPRETLRAIHAFVKYFFSCKHCSEHFQEMYAEDAETSVTSHDSSIIWLWKGHNQVNLRLVGAASEDPKHPKVQYPPRTLCPECWRDDSPAQPFKQQAVLAYLKKVYAKSAISLQNIVRPGKNSHSLDSLRQGKTVDLLQASDRGGRPKEGGRLQDDQNMQDDPPEINSQSMFRSLTEISTCMILYSATTLILAAAYFAVLIRKRIRRKKFIDMYKNPLNATGSEVAETPRA